MKVNTRKIVFLMSIFFTLAFAIQVNAQTWHCNWNDNTDCGDIFYLYYDESNYITGTIDYSQIVSNHWNNDFYFNSDEVMFQSNSYQQSTSYYGYIKFALSGTNYFFSNPIATNTRQNNTNCFGAYGGDLVYISKGEVLTMKFRQLNRFSDMSVLAFDTNGLTKSSIDSVLGQDSMEYGAAVGFSNLMYFDDDIDYCHDNSTDVYYPSGYDFPLGYNPEPVNGLCGLDDGETTNQEPPVYPNTLCQVGTATEIDFDGYQWTWNCLGTNGGENDSCVSYNTEAENATCGDDDGQTITEVDDFCNMGTLIFPSFVETTLGWTWTCAGANGGDNDFCSAYKSGLTLPELPEQDDCTQQQVPDRWFCEMSNALNSIFLPDANKINELQQTLNQINGRFPFNYLNVASNRFSTLKNNTNDDTMEISILGNEGNINLDGIEPLKEKTKLFTGGLFIVGFIFWGIGYIKHFFK